MKHWNVLTVASRSFAAVVRTTFLSDSDALLCVAIVMICQCS